MSEPYYQDDLVTLYHGDCRDVLPSIEGVALTVTSPPYNTLHKNTREASGMYKRRDNSWIKRVAEDGYPDEIPEAEYGEWQREVAQAIHSSTVPGGSFFYNHKCRWRDGTLLHPIDLVRSFDGWSLRQELIWDRSCSMTFNARLFPPSDERFYWMVKDGDKHTWNQEATAWLSVWRVTPERGIDGHPCPFPATLPERAIVATTNPGDTILDPFAGSGTTLRAAVDNGRKAIGVELEERYCEIIAKRMDQYALDFGAVA